MPEGPALDRRPTKVVTIKDGVQTTRTMSYADVIDLGGASRNTKNITSNCVWAGSATDCMNGSGTKMVQTDTTYFHPFPYYSADASNRSLLHLPQSITVTDPVRGLLARTNYGYDQFGLAASGAPNLDLTVGVTRGNVTAVTSFRGAAKATGGGSSVAPYLHTGSGPQSPDPHRNPSTMSYELCGWS